MPKALLVYPEFPPSYWSEKYALQFIDRKAPHPPLGLLTLAGLFPGNWELKLVDMNIGPLTAEDLQWCDYVFLSAMLVQHKSFAEVVNRCNEMGVKVVAGGPYPTSFSDDIEGVDYLVPGEVEHFFSDFLRQLEEGTAPSYYEPPEDNNGNTIRPGMDLAPPPRYDLLSLKDYGSVALQFSRGCPYDCEFCDITKLYGRLPRTKSAQQVLAELDMLYNHGWRGTVFFVDDNFIGNRLHAKRLLPEITKWQKTRGYPFTFYTEASVNLAEMDDLMDSMAEAGFDMVFLGLETPNPEALLQANKGHNIKTEDPEYLLQAVRNIQRHGLEVTAGFIIGLDGDDETSFDSQIDFIQKAGIPTAMVGLLTALKGTALYERFKREGRLVEESKGDNVSFNLTYVPKIDPQVLIEGYKRVLATLYDRSLRNYFRRCYTLIMNWQQRKYCTRPVHWLEIKAFFRTIKWQLFSRQGPAYLTFLFKVLFSRPGMISEAVRLAIMGYHYQMVTWQQAMVDDFKSFLDLECERLQERLTYYARRGEANVAEARSYVHQRFATIQKRYRAINKEFRWSVDHAVKSFQAELRQRVEELGRLRLEFPRIS